MSTDASLGPLKQIDAGMLNVGFAEAGPADGRVVLLLHGWPYDIHTYVDVAPLLAAQGIRCRSHLDTGRLEALDDAVPARRVGEGAVDEHDGERGMIGGCLGHDSSFARRWRPR